MVRKIRPPAIRQKSTPLQEAFNFPLASLAPSPPVVSHTAAGALGGFLHQVQWALVTLLRAGRADPSIGIRVEHLDDIEVVERDDGTVLIQVKSSIADRPKRVIDTATDLWSTLRGWADYVRLTPTPPSSEAFILITTAECAKGSAASLLATGSSADRETALQRLNHVAKSDAGATNAPAYAVWRSLTESQRLRILTSTWIIAAVPTLENIAAVVEREIIPTMPGDAAVERLRDSVLGWWVSRISRHIKNRSRDTIYFDEVVTAIRSRSNELLMGALPLDEEILAYAHSLEGIDELNTFVRQLRIIGVGNEQVLQAIIDVFRSEHHIDKWLRTDLFPAERLREYRRELWDRWRRRRAEINDHLPPDKDDAALKRAGQDLLSRVMAQQVPIKPDRAEEWIMSGTYHQLADGKTLGWHPDYEKLI